MGRIEIPKRMENQFKTLVICLRALTRPENMVLAGGTTLEMLWKHRDSTDIDLFVSNRTLIEISQAGKEAKTRAETRIQRVGEIAPEEGPGSGIIKGKIQGVTFSFCASDYIPWHRESSASISGTGVQCGHPREVLEGKILGRWSDAAKEERGGRTERRWVPARDVYDIAVARRLIPEQLGGTIGKLGMGTREKVVEWLKNVPEGWFDEDPKRIVGGKYDVDIPRTAKQIAEAVERNRVQEIDPPGDKTARDRRQSRGTGMQR